MRAKVYVTLKPGVHDPAGKAVVGGLNHLGFDEVKGVRIGKFFEIELDEGPDAEARLKAMCEKLLANTVIERYRVEIA
ncbi:MAG: phosphoribosylformylglycinamidine synthase subunit PurS [Deltaproteobacteria bacterium]|nr:phosphoribosylformylglycinamidine synthase subunit PurS [Deltaproteobacteria bacterium]MBM4393923.1 phosphoribosylformylglycinamidine synthase subunit PurS [Deltaproteobacteria bacterium]